MTQVDWESATLTEEMLETARQRIGVEWPTKSWHDSVTASSIRHFCDGLGDDNPLYRDASYAAASLLGVQTAPPAFLYTCNSGPADPGEGWGGGYEDLLPGIAGVWLEDTWLWREPIKLGDTIRGVSKIASLDEKETKYAGRAIEQITQTDFVNQDNRPIGSVWSNVMRFERSAARERSKYLDIIQEPYSYSDDEMTAIERAYLEEGNNRRGKTPRYWEDTVVGDQLPEIVKGPLTLTSMIGWVLGWGSPLYLTNRLLFRHLAVEPGGRLTNEWNCPDTLEGTHWDLNLARASGMPLPYDFAPMRVAWASHLLTDWMGDDAFLKRLSVRLRRPNLLGDTTWITGRISDRLIDDDGDSVVTVEVSGRNQREEQSIVASATVRLPVSQAQV